MFICLNNISEQLYKKTQQTGLLLLGLFLCVSPFPHTQTIGEVSFYSSLLIFLYIAKKSGVRFEKYGLWTLLLIFAGWCIFSSLFALDRQESFADLYSHLIKYLILSIMLVNFFGTRRGLTILARIIVASGLIFSITIMIYYYVILDNSFALRMGLPRWPTNSMGFVFLFSLALIYPLYQEAKSKVMKILFITSALILIGAVFLTQSRGTFLALIVMLCVFSLRMNKFLIIIITALLLTIASNTNIAKRFNNENVARKAIVLYTIEIIKDYPLFGIGYSRGSYNDPKQIDSKKYRARFLAKLKDNKNFSKYKNFKEYNWPHNIFLSYTVRTGIIGGLIFTCLLLYIYTNVIQVLRRNYSDPFTVNWSFTILASLTMFLVKGLFCPTTAHFVLDIFYTIFSMSIILIKISQKSSIGHCLKENKETNAPYSLIL